MARSSAIAVAAIGLAGAAALFVLGRGGGGDRAQAERDVGAAASAVESRLREATASVHARVTTLAELPRLKAAVATDAATVMDLTQEELAFRVKPGETIEIAQVPKGGGAALSLLKLPRESTVTARLDQPGVHIARSGANLVVTEVAEVAPTVNADAMRGAIALSVTMDAAQIATAVERVPGARVEWKGELLAGAADAPAGTPVVKETSWPDLRVIAPVPARRANVGLMGAGAALAVAGLIGAVVLARKRAPAPASPPVEAASGTAGRQDAFAATAMATNVTPPPAGASAGGSRAIPAQPSRVTPVPAMSGNLAIQASPSQAMGAQIGRYSIVKQLGSGGMAEVLLARSAGEAGFEKLFALKVIHRHLATDTTAIEHFLDEARIVSRLTHPNIVQIVDLGRAGEDYYIAMEFVDGRDLQSLMEGVRARGQQVPLRVALAIVRKVCDGLHAAHTAVAEDGHPLGIVHRDVKAANVLLSKAGAVKIADFGIAKANQQVHKTEFGQTKGTAAYMAPEQRMGKPVDKRADVFAVGAIAFEILTNNEVNLDLANLFHLGLEGWPHLPPPSQLRPELPVELDAIVFKALAFEPEHRHPDCNALEEEIDEVVARYGLGAGDKQVAQWVEGELAAARGGAAVKPT